MEQWDVVIVGAGPAGCAAAARLLQSAPASKVLLLDRSDFPRDKVCGDGIAAQAVDALAEVGLNLVEITAGYPRCPRIRLRSPAGRTAERVVAEPGFVIPRMVFDARLLSAVQARGAVFRRHSVRRLTRSADGVVLDGSIEAGVVIGADGAESSVRRLAGVPANRVGQVALAVRGYAPELPGQGGAQLLTMTENRWPAYAWSFPLGNGTANVGYGELLGEVPVSRGELIARMHDLLPGVEPTDIRGHRLPLSTGRPRVPGGRVLLVGDAQSLINPLSGEGIYYAVRSGFAAADAAPAGAKAGELYRLLLQARLGTHLRHTSLLARLTRRPWPIDAGVEAARRHQGVFDDLVDVALADGRISPRLVAGLVAAAPHRRG
jgi:geranylgeranyl reductase family protein